MADLEKTINDLERDRLLIYGLNLKSISDHIGDALELLKEQQNKIAELEEEAMVKGKPNKVINRKVLADLLVGECPLCGALFNNEICPVSCGWCGCLLDWKDGDGE